MYSIKRIHFIGIGGSGMSGIAEVLVNKGYIVSGSDICDQSCKTIVRLKELGINIYSEHRAENVHDVDIVVYSSAVDDTNQEISEAKRRKIPIMPRAQMLAELMRFNKGIAIAGTHGKTTTTSMLAHTFIDANLDPTFVIGGILNSKGTNAGLGKGEFFIAESDESDKSFLYVHPLISVITNIDRDHIQTYGGDIDNLKDSFIEFVNHIPFYGTSIMCIDDKNVSDISKLISRRIISYGFSKDADVMATGYKQIGFSSSFKIVDRTRDIILDATIKIPGRHNVLNALATYIVSMECDIDKDSILTSLHSFSGTERRLQNFGEINIGGKSVTLIDDYGHHPSEISLAIESIRTAYPNRRIVLAFQPHRYTRTKDLFYDFVNSLSLADVIILAEIYPASERKIHGISSVKLATQIKELCRTDVIYVSDISKMLKKITDTIEDGDILLIQGAGNIGEIPKCILSMQSDK